MSGLSRRGIADLGRQVGAPLGGMGLGLGAGFVFEYAATPLPWMIGPLLAIACARVAGVPVAAVSGGRQAGQWIIGTALGLYFTPVVAERVSDIAGLMVLGAIFAIGLGYACGFLLAVVGRTDRTTAVFASVPGGAAEMAILGERFGARVDEVAAAQSIRILLVVVTIPSVFAALKLHGADPFSLGASDVRWSYLAALLAATMVAGWMLQRLRVPNAFVLGALAIAIPLTAFGVQTSAIPKWMINGAQLLLGCALGSRFNRTFLRRAPRFVSAVALSVFVAMALSAFFAMAVAGFTGIHPATLVLATAPGGIAEMAITAKVLDLGVPLVTAFHVTRVILLLTCTAPLFAWLRKRRRRAARRDVGGPVA